jgi:hypothetical protein
MSAECCFTDDPQYVLKREYDGKPDVDSLHEIFVIVYKVDTPTKEIEKSARYVFIKSLDRAIKQWKLFGPKGALLHRIFTDDNDINQLALHNEIETTEHVLETESLEPIKITEVEIKPGDGDVLNRITYDA